MTWTETKSKDERRNELRDYVIERFKDVYPFTENADMVTFSLSDGVSMHVFSMGGAGFDCLAMEYHDVSDPGDCDGDLHYIDDYETPEALFNAMLKETKRETA